MGPDAPASSGAGLLTAESLEFLRELTSALRDRRQELLAGRRRPKLRPPPQAPLDFLEETRAIRRGDWALPPAPADLRDRRVEITGPTDRKMVINALNSGAQVFMADFEDSHAPLWELTLRGQQNLFEAVRGRLEFTSPEGKEYRLRSPHAVLMVRPRGLHLEEEAVRIEGLPVPAGIFDLGLYLFHNARELLRRGSGPYLYLPKIQSWEEAAWWGELLDRAEELLGIRRGSVRVTVLIETLPAAFQMQEILHALRSHALGLNFGRWDYLFSFIKTFRADPRFVLPERARLTMDTPFMLAASRLLVETCHARGGQAVGGMAADIPVKEDAALNFGAVERVSADKRRELAQGYDGTWVAHPALVPVALAVFHDLRPAPVPVAAASVRTRDPDPHLLLEVPKGDVSPTAVRANANVALQYLEAWLRGTAAVAIHHRMEDTATAEICRSQLWQWVHLGVPLAGGRSMSAAVFQELLQAASTEVRQEVGEVRWASGAFPEAARTLEAMVLSPTMDDFLPLRAMATLSQVTLRFRT